MNHEVGAIFNVEFTPTANYLFNRYKYSCAEYPPMELRKLEQTV